MKKRFLTAIILTALLAFALGWSLHNMENEEDVNGKNAHQTQVSDSIMILQSQLDSFRVLNNINIKTENFAAKISGRFVMKNTNCAGLNFINPTLASWTNEMDCWHPDTLRIRWIDNTTFYTQDINRLNENCPPRVWIYQVISFDGEHLELNNIWTGWGFSIAGDKMVKDSRLEFSKREMEE